ncbi:MAG: acyl-CoA dehydrogenase [Rhodospirillaceae bacterium]|nr:acyl-CoA dehydrogenase [Rhodospirillaceae bacterium]|tara:strand:- start:114 stop:1259 length:1146 start_codon:yes stop_codon:yes gene_type:complete
MQPSLDPALCDAIVTAAEEIERTRRIPPSLMTQIHRARLSRMLLPRAFDGDELEPGAYLATIEAIARCDASVAWNLFVANSAALMAPHLEPETARTIFSAPDALVAWGPPNATVAKVEDGGYRVTGRWDFASGCRQATWMGVHCRVQEPDGTFRQNQFGQPAIRSMLFPVANAELLDTWDTIGLRGTASDSYTVENLFIEEAFTGTREMPEARRDPNPLYGFPMQGIYAVGVAGVALGTAGAMLDDFKILAADKTPRGYKRLADSGTIQSGVARSEVKLGAARAYTLETLAEIYDRAGAQGAIDIPDRARVRLATANAINGAIEVADWVYKQAGVDAIFAGSAFQRRFRDIHTLSQQIQSRDAHFEAVGQVLLGQSPEVFF